MDGDSKTWLTRPGALRVPQITIAFWVIKGLSTAMGESTSDYLVHAMAPQLAVVLGFAAFVVALVIQFRAARYSPWRYWFAVAMVGVFGTMAADVLHVGLGVPYPVSTILYAVVLAAVFISWERTEHTLSIHTVDTPRKEAFYWATVVATFAMGTALGDFMAYTLHLGYFASAVIFAAVIAVPAIGYRWMSWNAIFAFWSAYVITRPLGASIADWFGKPHSDKGLGLGAGPVALGFSLAIVAMVCFVALSERSPRTEPGPTEQPQAAALLDVGDA